MGFANTLTFAFMHHPYLACLHTFWHAIPTSFYIFNVFYFLVVWMQYSLVNIVWGTASTGGYGIQYSLGGGGGGGGGGVHYTSE